CFDFVAVLFVEADARLLVGLEVTGDSVAVCFFGKRYEQPGAEALPLTRRLDSQKPKVPVPVVRMSAAHLLIDPRESQRPIDSSANRAFRHGELRTKGRRKLLGPERE